MEFSLQLIAKVLICNDVYSIFIKKELNMATLQLRVDDELKRKSDDLFQSNVCRASEDLSLEKAISDTRKQENLHGHYSSAQEAVASMLDD
ncbi:hypothetical protein [Fibrobacter sp.]|uniref:hypothetical protein n=1 Tax=Fibrobacter sp. TaxID=35828 RepID=UPI0025BCC38F|nr:hypothetical protein [Fibrobacter sp.]MBR3072878.1 hypothetical protein [Fibrobacter sp.]